MTEMVTPAPIDVDDVRVWAIEMCDVCEVGHVVEYVGKYRAVTECAEAYRRSEVTDDRPRIVCAECLSRMAKRARSTTEAT